MDPKISYQRLQKNILKYLEQIWAAMAMSVAQSICRRLVAGLVND